jgi:2-dehydropantoate 2-reductase
MISGLRVGVMGAGAVGGYFGARLAQLGAVVTLIGRAGHVRAISEHGLALTSGGVLHRVPLAASTDVAALADAEVVLVCVKSTDTDAAATSLAPVLSSEALIVSLQNGFDNAWRIRERAAQAVVPTAVYVSAEMTGPGQLLHNGGGQIVVGKALAVGDGGAASERLDRLVAGFEAAGIVCRRSADIRVDLWTKLTSNCAYNAISALTELRYHHLASDTGIREVMQLVTEENAAVAQADGVPVVAAALHDAVRRIAEVMPGALSSTAQDLQRGRRTEIDHLNGYVVRRGQALGVPTPVNRTLLALVSLAERTRDVRG